MEEKLEFIAKICHEVNRAYCATLGDFSQDPWDQTPKCLKESVINGVKFKMENPDVTPERMHENWMKKKHEDGWEFGPVKDVVHKQHPCMVPYNQLPQDQKVKDVLFMAVVNAMA